MRKESAEQYARPFYKWIGRRRTVANTQNCRISNFPGGIVFSFFNYSNEKALKVILKAYREDGSCERFLSDAYYCGELGGGWQKWQTHRLPLFPFESLHGRIRQSRFSYIIHKGGRSIPSRFEYKFGTLQDFQKGRVENNDFHELKGHNDYASYELNQREVQHALDRINNDYGELPLRPFFTRGNVSGAHHPIHEIHRQIDRVIERKRNDRKGRHFIQIALYDFDNLNIADHLIYAKRNGVDVECCADWSAVSSMNFADSVARMRRAGIPICGVVRNTPCDPSQGIASMHTKIIIFDGVAVHSSSYNLHFHLWGGNWENGLFYYSRDFALLYANIYHAIRGGVVQRVGVNPAARYNVYYSFGRYYTSWSGYYRPQDAILSEIERAGESITVCMFDLGHLSGRQGGHNADVVNALIGAKNRGVRVRLLLNGMFTHTGRLPEAWDLNFRRQLKEPAKRLRDAGVRVASVFYHGNIYSPLHHKFAVFDNRTVITESYNWHEAGVHSDEVLSVIRDDRIAREFMREADLICETFRVVWE